MFGSVSEACGLANTIIIDAIIGDVRLIGERRPSTEHEWILTDRLHRLCKINGHKSTRHLRVSLVFSVMLFSPEVPQILRQQLTASYTTTVVIQVIVDKVGVSSIDARNLFVLILRAITFVVFVKHIVVINERVCGIREKF